MRRLIATVIAGIGALPFSVVSAQIKADRKVEHPNPQKRVTWIGFEGEYNNPRFAYHVMVPSGLTGHKAPPPAPAHGFEIDLATEDDASVSVDGSYNTLFLRSALNAAQQTLELLKKQNGVLGNPRYEKCFLDTIPATKLRVTYRDRKSEKLRVLEQVTALRNSNDGDAVGIIYGVTLDTTLSRVRRDDEVLTAILRSFRLNPLSR